MARTLAALLGRRAHEVAIFEAFAENIDESITAPDLEAITDVPHTTIYRILEQMEGTGAINLVGQEGRTQHFRLNTSNPIIRVYAQAFHKAQAEALEAEMEEGWRPALAEHGCGFAPTTYDPAEINLTAHHRLGSDLLTSEGA